MSFTRLFLKKESGVTFTTPITIGLDKDKSLPFTLIENGICVDKGFIIYFALPIYWE
jgi:hypothetical protein